jgi:hypothetical protein
MLHIRTTQRHVVSIIIVYFRLLLLLSIFYGLLEQSRFRLYKVYTLPSCAAGISMMQGSPITLSAYYNG